MTREIKFRAWDGKKVKKDIHISLFKDGWSVEGIDKGDVILMQYTGLKDENGVEIYEGDVVETPSQAICKITYSKDHYCGFVAEEIRGNWHWNISQIEVTVIGNIYENPELL